jgi:hypothetical protein
VALDDVALDDVALDDVAVDDVAGGGTPGGAARSVEARPPRTSRQSAARTGTERPTEITVAEVRKGLLNVSIARFSATLSWPDLACLPL